MFLTKYERKKPYPTSPSSSPEAPEPQSLRKSKIQALLRNAAYAGAGTGSITMRFSWESSHTFDWAIASTSQSVTNYQRVAVWRTSPKLRWMRINSSRSGGVIDRQVPKYDEAQILWLLSDQTLRMIENQPLIQ